jgi:titin
VEFLEGRLLMSYSNSDVNGAYTWVGVVGTTDNGTINMDGAGNITGGSGTNTKGAVTITGTNYNLTSIGDLQMNLQSSDGSDNISGGLSLSKDFGVVSETDLTSQTDTGATALFRHNGSFSTGTAAGSWILSGPGVRGVATIASNGSISGTYTNKDGTNGTFSGNESFNGNGTGTLNMTATDPVNGPQPLTYSLVMDDSQDVIGLYDAVPVAGKSGDFNMLVRQGSGISGNDAAGVWYMTNANDHGFITMDNAGHLSAVTLSAGSTTVHTSSGTYTLGSNGAVTVSVTDSGGTNQFVGQMSSGKNVIVVTSANLPTGNNDTGFTVLVHIGGSGPLTPTGLAATSANGQVTLTWNNLFSGQTGYTIDRSTDGVNYTPLPATLGATASSYVDSGMAPATYYYEIQANGATNSAFSAPVTAATGLAVPQNLALTVVSPTQNTLTWSYTGTTQTNFRIQRSIDGGITFSQIAKPLATDRSYTDTSAPAGTACYYRIRADGTTSNSNFSTPVWSGMPTNLIVTPTGATQNTVAWSFPFSGQAGFRIDRSTDGVNFNNKIATPLAGDRSFVDTQGLVAGQTYYYRIRANSTIGGVYSPFTTGVWSAMPTGVNVVPAAGGQNTITWSFAGSGQTGFRVDRSPDGVNWSTKLSPNPAATARSITDTTAVAGTAYYYRVRANSPVGGEYSSFTTPVWSAMPTGVTPMRVSATEIDVAWSFAYTGQMTFLIDRSPDGVNFNNVGIAAASARVFADTKGITANGSYYYRVRTKAAIGGGVFSSYTPVIWSATPTSFQATPVSSSEIDLSWAFAYTGQSGFRVDWSTDGVNFTKLPLFGAGARGYQFTGLSAGTYYFRILARSSAANSPYTAVISATV